MGNFTSEWLFTWIYVDGENDLDSYVQIITDNLKKSKTFFYKIKWMTIYNSYLLFLILILQIKLQTAYRIILQDKLFLMQFLTSQTLDLFFKIVD